MKYTEKRPLDSSIVIILSGAFIVAIGVIGLVALHAAGDRSIVHLLEVITGTTSGAGVVISGTIALKLPEKHAMMGVIAILLGALSFMGTSGGLFLGAFGSIIGGVMSISWHPKLEKERSPSATSK